MTSEEITDWLERYVLSTAPFNKHYITHAHTKTHTKGKTHTITFCLSVFCLFSLSCIEAHTNLIIKQIR